MLLEQNVCYERGLLGYAGLVESDISAEMISPFINQLVDS